MKRPTTRIVLALLLLLAVALLLRREAREKKPHVPPPPAPSADVVEAPPPPSDPPAPEKVVVPGPPAPKQATTPPRPPPIGPLPGWEALKSGSLRGIVKIGAVPHPDDVVDSEGHVQWAFVYLVGIQDLPPELMPPLLINQDGCTFDPHVLGIRVGQQLDVSAKDSLGHKVRFVSSENRDVRFGREGVPAQSRSFRRPEIMVKIACDLHYRSSAWIGVLDHPYFAVTNEAGGYGIADIPPGRYLVKVWHERWTDLEQVVEIPVAGDVQLKFTFLIRKG